MEKRDKLPPLIILLSGKARSGKDTIGEIIKQELQTGIITEKSAFVSLTATLGFADMLKNVCARNHEYVGKKETRKVLLDIGDEMRNIDPNVFVKPVVQFIDVYHKMGYGAVVVTDTRFENEYDYINDYAIGIPYMLRVESINGHEGVEEFTISHPSEKLSFDYDYLIDIPKLTNEAYSNLVDEIRRILSDIVDDYWGRLS